MAHYVNNKDFLEALIDHREKCKDAKENGAEKPRVSNYIGECILKIATHLSYKPNFINYSYRDDMILDGVENCIQYLDNFNPDKSQNPFAYFTQIIYYAFLRRIAKEKKQSYIKGKLIMDMSFDSFEVQDDDEREFHNAYMQFVQQNRNFDEVTTFEEKKRKKKKNKIDLDDFIEGDKE